MTELVGEGVIHIRTDSAGVDVPGEGRKAGLGYTKGFTTGIKGIATGIAGVLAAREVLSFAKESVGEARESQKVGAATVQTIKATGDAANVTSTQVGDLATALSNKTGVDDEAIQSGANLVLTFKNIRNEAGAGNDIFNQTVAATQDVAAAGFGSIESASKSLGKALNDPVKGITALGRAGITFTADQQAQIKALVANNDLLDAQKIILGEVQHQVGGVAAATATSGEKAATAYANLKETIGNQLLPIIDAAERGFTNKLAPALQGFITGSSGAGKAVRQVTGFLGEAAHAVHELFSADDGSSAFGEILDHALGNTGKYVGPLRALGNAVLGFVQGVKDAAHDAAPILRELADKALDSLVKAGRNLTPVIKPLAKELTDLVASVRLEELQGAASALSTIFDGLVSFTGFLGKHVTTVQAIVVGLLAAVAAYKAYQIIVGIVTAAQAALNFVLAANPIGVVVLALVALAAGLIYAYKHSERFREIVDKVAHAVTSALGTAIDFVKDHWVLIASLIGGPIVAVAIQVVKHFDDIKGAVVGAITFLASLPDRVTGLVGKMARAGRQFIGGLLDGILGAAKGAGGVVEKIGDAVYKAIKAVVNGAISLINNALPNKISIPGAPDIDLPDNPIPHLARGTQNWPGGWSWVGEEGPELMNVPRGAQVVPAARSAALVGAGGGKGGTTITIGQMMPHDYNEWERQMNETAHAASLGGPAVPVVAGS